MKKIVFAFIVLVGICCVDVNYGAQPSEKQLAQELKTAIQNKDFQVITLTREGSNPEVLHLSEFHELLKYIMSSICNRNVKLTNIKSTDDYNTYLKKTKSSKEAIEGFVNKYFKESIQNKQLTTGNKDDQITFIGKVNTDKDKMHIALNVFNKSNFLINMKKTYMSNLQRYYISKIGTQTTLPILPTKRNDLSKDKWTFVVFQEFFFAHHAGGEKVLDSDYVEKIVEYTKKASLKNNKTIFFVNFLREFTNGKKDIDYSDKFTERFSEYINNHEFLQKDTKDFYATQATGENKLFCNYTLVIHKGKSIALYCKSSYKEECNELRDLGYKYILGNLKPKVLVKNAVSDLLFGSVPMCNILICADLNVLSASVNSSDTNHNKYKEYADLFNRTPINIIQSASFSVSQFFDMHKEYDLFQAGSLIINADEKDSGRMWKYNNKSVISNYYETETNEFTTIFQTIPRKYFIKSWKSANM